MVEHVQDAIAKTVEIAVTIRVAFQNFDLIVGPFRKAVGVGTVKRI
jgi:hypothetical protein